MQVEDLPARDRFKSKGWWKVAPLVGILLDRRVLHRALHGGRTFERVDYYAEAAESLGVDLVFFDLDGLRLGSRRVSGFAPVRRGTSGRGTPGRLEFVRRTVPLPSVVHKRALYRSRRASERVRRLERDGVYVFNPEVSWDKYRIDRMLRGEPRLVPHLPETALVGPDGYSWFRAQLEAGTEVFVKPRQGSLGLGIARVVPLGGRRCRFEAGGRRIDTTLRGAWRLVRRGRRRHLMQAGVPLLEEEGRRVDLRVPVQRGGDGRWHIAGIAAKRAERHAFLTNVARGASVHMARELLARRFGAGEAARVVRGVEELAVTVAQTLSARHPRVADLGLDVGVDRRGHPYLIEVNRRDLRVMLGMCNDRDGHRALFANPIAYARHVLVRGASHAG